MLQLLSLVPLTKILEGASLQTTTATIINSTKLDFSLSQKTKALPVNQGREGLYQTQTTNPRREIVIRRKSKIKKFSSRLRATKSRS
jgi:hypothetical protein